VKVLSQETNLGIGTTVSSATVVRAYNSDDSVGIVTRKDSGGSDVGNLSIPSGKVVYLEKKFNDTLIGDSTVKASKIAYSPVMEYASWVPSGAGGGNASGQFTDWGGDTPVWNTSYTRYNIDNSNSPNPSDSIFNPGQHYGMCTDSWGRYMILTQRSWPESSGSNGSDEGSIWIPITSSGPNLAGRFVTRLHFWNSFGGLVDTIRGSYYQARYNTSDNYKYDLPSALIGANSSPTAGSNWDLTPYDASGTLNYNSNNNDGGCHDGWNDMYYFTGRGASTTWSYNPSNPTAGFTTINPTATQERYGLSKDPSSNWFVSTKRIEGWHMYNGVDGGADATYSNVSSDKDYEDVAIAWTGDLYAYKGRDLTIDRFTRTG